VRRQHSGRCTKPLRRPAEAPKRKLTSLARELGLLGWQVHVALVRRGPNWTRLQESGAIAHEVPSVGGYDSRKLTRLRRIIDDVWPARTLWAVSSVLFLTGRSRRGAAEGFLVRALEKGCPSDRVTMVS